MFSLNLFSRQFAVFYVFVYPTEQNFYKDFFFYLQVFMIAVLATIIIYIL